MSLKGAITIGERMLRRTREDFINENGKVMRPRNCYMIWLAEARQGIHATNQADLCVSLSTHWRNLSNEVKEYYRILQDEEKYIHRKLFPNYKYKSQAYTSQANPIVQVPYTSNIRHKIEKLQLSPFKSTTKKMYPTKNNQRQRINIKKFVDKKQLKQRIPININVYSFSNEPLHIVVKTNSRSEPSISISGGVVLGLPQDKQDNKVLLDQETLRNEISTQEACKMEELFVDVDDDGDINTVNDGDGIMHNLFLDDYFQEDTSSRDLITPANCFDTLADNNNDMDMAANCFDTMDDNNSDMDMAAYCFDTMDDNNSDMDMAAYCFDTMTDNNNDNDVIVMKSSEDGAVEDSDNNFGFTDHPSASLADVFKDFVPMQWSFDDLLPQLCT